MCNKLRMKTLLNIPDLFLTVLLLVAFQASASKSQNNISLSCKENNNLYKTLKENKIACVRRVSEMAPFVNNVVSVAREKGVLIVHAPSDCMNYYNNTPARKLGQKYKSKKALGLISDNKLDSEKILFKRSLSYIQYNHSFNQLLKLPIKLCLAPSQQK